MLKIVKGIYIKNGLFFKQKHKRYKIYKYEDYFILYNQLIYNKKSVK